MYQSGCGKPPSDPVRQPVINSPYDYPCWHYRVDNSGLAIRGEASPGRRPSEAYLSPVPLPMGYQQVLSGTQDPLSSMDHINQLRQRVEDWRQECKRRSNNVPRGRLKHRLTALENWTVRRLP